MRCPMLVLLLVSALALASCSASKVPPQLPSRPLAADLLVEPEPPLSAAALGSEQAYEAWNEDVRAWGRRGWDRVARLCRWHQSRSPELACPKPAPETPR